MLPSEVSPTRSAILQLQEEQGVTNETYDFLDEKRLLVAAELLKQLATYEELLRDYEVQRKAAEQALVMTVRRHGLHGTQVYPGTYLEGTEIQQRKTRFMGISLLETSIDIKDDLKPGHICRPTPEAEHCRKQFQLLTELAVVIAGVSGNLHRLLDEYKKTERRARALENVIIPEIEQKLGEIRTTVDEMDQEDVVRIHLNTHTENMSGL